jgi:DNA-binding response OmpR family regulator
MRLLLVEDSQRLQRSLGAGLRRAGYALDVAADGPSGLDLAVANPYDVIILDLMLPGLDGMSLLRQLRERDADAGADAHAHVLILTARDTIEDRVRGLREGADDFLTKPFSFDELLARIQALLRRRHGQRHPRLVIGPLVIDTTARQVLRDGRPVTLAPREYALLEYLAVRQGHVVTRSEIEDHVYDGRTELASNAVDSAVCALRRRIDAPGAPSLIETRRGQGYVLDGTRS